MNTFENWNLPITIRPSPEPMSSSFSLVFFWRSRKILLIWLLVAGTYGKQYLRNAGVTNGAQIILSPIAAPPLKFKSKQYALIVKKKTRYKFIPHQSNRLEFYRPWTASFLDFLHFQMQYYSLIRFLLMTFLRLE